MPSARQIGPIGTLARVLVGTVAIALPVALTGITWIDAVIAFTALPLLAGLAAPLARRTPAPGCVLLCAMVLLNAALVAPTSANGNVTIWVWLGASMLVAAVRGYAGCEVLAIPNLLTGRRSQVGCPLFTPIDSLESRRRITT
jgi:hypothetical protein